MYEIAAVAAAVAFAVAWFAGARRSRYARPVFAAMMMFLGASLMWGVDCVAEAMSGEEALDMSRDAASLAALILGAGLAVFAAMCVAERLRGSVPAKA